MKSDSKEVKQTNAGGSMVDSSNSKPYQSNSKYFSKCKYFVTISLVNRRRVSLTNIERAFAEYLFNTKKFEPQIFFETSNIYSELQVYEQDFDSVIESLIRKKVLVVSKNSNTCLLRVTI